MTIRLTPKRSAQHSSSASASVSNQSELAHQSARRSGTPVSTTIYLSLSLSAQQSRKQDATPPLDAHARQTKSTVRSHHSTFTHDRLNLQRTAPLIDTHTPDQTHSTQQSYAHSSIALSHAAPSDPSHAHSLPLTHPIHSLVGTTLSSTIFTHCRTQPHLLTHSIETRTHPFDPLT